MGNKYSVYLAGPISGLDYENGTAWRDTAVSILKEVGIDAYSPLRRKGYLEKEGELTGSYENWPLSTQRGIYARDRFDCHRADLVIANLLNSKIVSIGTCMEIAWAAQNNTPVVLIMENDNIHYHPMIMEASPFVVESLTEGLDVTMSILLP